MRLAMNYLMHLYLAGDDRESLVGNMMGDFVKGRLDDRYSPGIRSGIVLHRKIDSFAAGNRVFMQSKKRLDDSYGHYKGILVDIFYDHFLAVNWEKYSIEPFTDYISRVYAILEDFEPTLPERLRYVLPRMFSSNWLLSYQDLGGVDTILQRMSARIARPNLLAKGLLELTSNYGFLDSDFSNFMPEIQEYVSHLSRTA
jgi:acyl carrier protein phosphodiesterase